MNDRRREGTDQQAGAPAPPPSRSGNQAHRGKPRIKTRLIGTCDPDDWDLPLKPKWMRWATYRRLVDRFERYDEVVDDHFVGAIGWLMKCGSVRDFDCLPSP
jgi:hypothetical protein